MKFKTCETIVLFKINDNESSKDNRKTEQAEVIEKDNNLLWESKENYSEELWNVLWVNSKIERSFRKELWEESESFEFLEELVKSWKYKWEDIEKKVDIEDGGIVWKWYLDIRWTKVNKIKAKKIEWFVDAEWVESLEEIEVEEEIGWYLEISWTSIDFQLKIIEKINKWELKVKWQLYFWEDIEGIERLCEDKNLVIPWDLDIRRTKVKRIKIKRIKWSLDAEWVESLEEIEVEEIVWHLYIRETKTKRIKAKRIKWSLDVEWVESLEEIEVEEEIGWYLDIRGTSIDSQLKIIKKINKWELKIKWKVYFWGKVERIERLCEDKNLVIPWDLDIRETKVKRVKVKVIKWDLNVKWVESLEEMEVEEEIGWYLDIRGTSIDSQLKIIEKINKWELKVKWKVSFWGNIERIERLCEDKNLVIPWDLDINWTKVKRIKVKRIKWNLNAVWVENLEEIEVEEEIRWNLYIRWTSIDFQRKIIDKINKWELKVSWEVIYDKKKIN